MSAKEGVVYWLTHLVTPGNLGAITSTTRAITHPARSIPAFPTLLCTHKVAEDICRRMIEQSARIKTYDGVQSGVQS